MDNLDEYYELDNIITSIDILLRETCYILLLFVLNID